MGWRWDYPPPPPKERTWDQWKYYGMEIGYSPTGGGQSENITSRRATYAGGKNEAPSDMGLKMVPTHYHSLCMCVWGEGGEEICHRFAMYKGTLANHNMVLLADKSASGEHKNCHTQAMYTSKHPWLCKSLSSIGLPILYVTDKTATKQQQ